MVGIFHYPSIYSLHTAVKLNIWSSQTAAKDISFSYLRPDISNNDYLRT